MVLAIGQCKGEIYGRFTLKVKYCLSNLECFQCVQSNIYSGTAMKVRQIYVLIGLLCFIP